jgi:hypothetical protein
MEITKYYCDDCLKEFDQSKLWIVKEFQFCNICINKRLEKSIALYIPARKCPECHGEGYVKTLVGHDPCGKNEYETVVCKHEMIRKSNEN